MSDDRAPRITGIGLIAPDADTPAALFERCARARLPDAASADDTPELPIEGFEIRDHVPRRGLKDLSRTSRLAIAAASKLAPALDGVPADRVGLVLGTAWASLDTIVRFEWEAQVEGPRFVDPILFTETVANVPAGQVSIVFGWSALNLTECAGTASGLAALNQARELLDEGRAPVVVAGGADELNAQMLRARDPEAGRCIGSEGACLLALEPAEGARARGARVLGRLGAGLVRLAGGNDRAGIERRTDLLSGVLRGEGLEPADVDLVVLTGSGERGAARVEAGVLAAAFGDRPPPAVVLRELIGETWGASGPFGIALALAAGARGANPAAPSSPISLTVRRALIVDCTADAQFALQLVGVGE